jgi:hypothetical protein
MRMRKVGAGLVIFAAFGGACAVSDLSDVDAKNLRPSTARLVTGTEHERIWNHLRTMMNPLDRRPYEESLADVMAIGEYAYEFVYDEFLALEGVTGVVEGESLAAGEPVRGRHGEPVSWVQDRNADEPHAG